MLDKRDYVIQISKLKMGSNHCDLQVNKELFEEFGCTEAESLVCDVELEIWKQERLLEFRFAFKGEMTLICGRCLSAMHLPIDKKTTLYVKFGGEYSEPDDMERVIPEGENDVDILSYIYEELRLIIPISPVHSDEKDCDRTMIEKLRADVRSEDDGNDFDPRWEKLKELKK